MEQSEKDKRVQLALDKISKQFGKTAVMKLSDKPECNVEVIPTGSLTLDVALGVGGFPRGRIVEIYGLESAGKSSIAIHAVAEAQKLGGNAAYIDVECAFDPQYSTNLGVDIEKLYFAQPDFGEQALEIAINLIESGGFDILVVDSVAALIPKAELDGEMGDAKMGLQARMMSQAMRKMVAVVSKSNTCVIFINQLREKIGVVYGSNEVTTGGNALKFYASIRLDVRRSAQVKDGDEVMGNLTKVKVTKNKVAPPFKIAQFDIMYGKGISKSGEIVDLGVEAGIIKKAGSWYSYGETRLGQGRDGVKQLLEDNPELMDELEIKIKAQIN